MASSRGGKVTAIAAAERTLGQAVDAFLTSRPPPPGCSPSSPAAATAGRCL
jgi:hypothetical protein